MSFALSHTLQRKYDYSSGKGLSNTLFCTYCRSERLANESPCPNCGAPSPLVDGSLPDASSQQGIDHSVQNEIEVPQLSFDDSLPPFISANGFTPLPQPPAISFDADPQYPNNMSTQHLNPLQTDASNANASPHALVPYQPETPPSQGQTTMSLQLIPEHMVEHLLPAQSQQAQVDTQDVVRIPSFYKSERLVVPRKHILGGLVSIIIVSLLLCVGASYLIKANGTWDRLVQFINPAPPASLHTTSAPQLPEPTVTYEKGDASDTIPSAVLTDDFNQQDAVVRQEAHDFQKGQMFFLVCSGLPAGLKGTLGFKWYMNALDYTDSNYQLAPDAKDANKLVITLLPSASASKGTIVKTIDAGAGTTGTIDLSMQYLQSAEGYVEVYWNNKLAWRLYFVVR